jgi:ribonuclease BN (tRNA processing enzyme)
MRQAGGQVISIHGRMTRACHVMNRVTHQPSAESPPLPATAPGTIVDTVFSQARRVLLVGQPGIGKSTLVDALAGTLGQAGRECACIDADPGSPRFGVPGAISLMRWNPAGWSLAGLEALCTLDAGRFRLPLVAAVQRLAQSLSGDVVLVDGPGVVRGVAGAELLVALVAAARIEAVLALTRTGRPLPLQQELGALTTPVYAIQAAATARRPGKRVRARSRTVRWDAYLGHAGEQLLEVGRLRITGTPPPLTVPETWTGRQVALLEGERTVAMGEVLTLEGNRLRVRLPPMAGNPATLLVRDAARFADGCLATVSRFTADRLEYLPPPDIAPAVSAGATGGPRVVGRVGMLQVALVNGVFGDPLLHLRLRHQRRSLLFDLGDGARLPARVAHQVSDVFITHAHIDHIAGFLWLLRSRIGEFPVCRLYGPPGLAGNIEGMTRGILWDRVGDEGPCFVVAELHGGQLRRFRVQAGCRGVEPIDRHETVDGILLSDPGFRVRTTTLAHESPVLAFAFEPERQINIRKEKLLARELKPGPWLGELKQNLLAGSVAEPVRLPDGSSEPTQALADELVLITPGKKLAYATDFADTADNRQRLVALARGAHTLFCEATFRETDSAQAVRTAHLTTRACGEIAVSAGVARLVPFHFSRRYEHDPAAVYEEIATYCPQVALPKSMSVFETAGHEEDCTG